MLLSWMQGALQFRQFRAHGSGFGQKGIPSQENQDPCVSGVSSHGRSLVHTILLLLSPKTAVKAPTFLSILGWV